MLFQALALTAATAASALSIAPRQAITSFDSSPISFEFPAGREGFSAADANDAPCGGRPLGARTNFPLVGGDIALLQLANARNLNIMYTNETNPDRFHAFGSYTNSIVDIGPGHYCAEGPDFGSLGFEAGDVATLLLIYQLDEAETYFYQCADVSLVETASFVAPEFTCGNYTSTLQIASEADSLKIDPIEPGTGVMPSDHPAIGDATPSSTAGVTAQTPSTSSGSNESNNNSSSSSSGLSAAAGGGIGAAVAIAVLFGLAALAYGAGYVRFGKKRAMLAQDDESVTSTQRAKMVSRA